MMAEPTTTTGAAAYVGLAALLVGAFGPVAADVMMVVLAALAGCYVALSAVPFTSAWEVIKFMVLSVLVSLLLAWALTGLVTGMMPVLSGPYTPSLIAMAIGFVSNRLPEMFNRVLQVVTKRLGG